MSCLSAGLLMRALVSRRVCKKQGGAKPEYRSLQSSAAKGSSSACIQVCLHCRTRRGVVCV